MSSYHIYNECDVAIIPFIGGTPSGDALGTTLCNTMLSLMYQILYLVEIGVEDPWDFEQCKRQGIFYQAAGDDTCVHMQQKWVAPYLNVLDQRVAKKKNQQKAIGLGQVVKFQQIRVGDFDQFDFCSKLIYSDGTIQGLQMFRNPIKTLTTKQFYINKNAKIYKNPCIHPLALYMGIKSQKFSMLVQEIMRWRISNCLQKAAYKRKKQASIIAASVKKKSFFEKSRQLLAKRFANSDTLADDNIDNPIIEITQQQLQYIDQKVMFAYVEEQGGYQCQAQINDMLGISIRDLYHLSMASTINLCDINGNRRAVKFRRKNSRLLNKTAVTPETSNKKSKASKKNIAQKRINALLSVYSKFKKTDQILRCLRNEYTSDLSEWVTLKSFPPNDINGGSATGDLVD